MEWVRRLRRRSADDRGVTGVEYGLIVAGVAAVAIPGIVAISNALTDSYSTTTASQPGVCVGAGCNAIANDLPAASITNTTQFGAPTPPQNFQATPGDGTVQFTWSAPQSTGGSSLTGYVVTSSPASSGCTVAATATTCTVTGLTNGTPYTFSVVATNANLLTSSPATVVVTPGKAQSISFTWTDAGAVIGGTSSVSATTTSGLETTFTSTTTGVCSVGTGTLSGSTTTATVTYFNAGPCTITASQGGDSTWLPATSVSQTVTVGKKSQSISFSWSDANAKSGGASSVSASTTSELQVTFTSSDTSVCTVSSGTFSAPATTAAVDYVGAGSCTITASQGGDSTWLPATSVPQTVTVGKKSQSITFSWSDANAKVGGSSPVSAEASSGLAVTFTSANTAICTVSTGTLDGTVTKATVTYVAAGSCTITASQGGNPTWDAATSLSQSVTVSKKSQSISFSWTDSNARPTRTSTVSAEASSGLIVTFTSSDTSICTVSAGSLSGSTTTATVTYVASGTCTITASQDGNTTWEAASAVSQSVTVAGKPSKPTDLQATSGSQSVSLSWTAPDDNGAAITDYVIEYKRGSSSTWLKFDDGSGTTATATVTGLRAGITYDFRVSAVNVVGESDPSAVVSQAATGTCAALPAVTITGAGSATATVTVLPSDLAGGKLTATSKTSASNTGTMSATSPTSDNAAWTGYSGSKTWTGTYSYTATNCSGTATGSNLSVSSN